MDLDVSSRKKTYNYGIDFLKGILILGVIGIHVVNGDWRINLNSYILHSCIVPVFLGLSGYLVNHDYIENSSLVDVFRKYFKRMIRPWLIACVCYYILDLLFGWTVFSITSLFRMIFLPSYHLWYVLAFMVYLCILWGMKKIHIQNSVLFIISVIISLIWVRYFDYNYNWSSETVNLFFLKYKFHYFAFFVFGYSLHELDPHKDVILKRIIGGFACILALYRLSNYLQLTQIGLLTTLDFFVMNLALILFLIPKFEEISFFTFTFEEHDSQVILLKTLNTKGKIFLPITMIGKYSLEVYLWHLLIQYIILG